MTSSSGRQPVAGTGTVRGAWLARNLPDYLERAKVLTVGAIVGVLLWTGLAVIFPNDLMPYPIETLQIVVELVLRGAVWEHMAATLWRSLWAFTGAFLLGNAVGVIMGTSRYGQQFFGPYFIIGLTMPPIVWAAAMTLVFGFSVLAPITAALVSALPIVIMYIWKGVENIDRDLVEMSRAFEVPRRRVLRRMLIPNIAPAEMGAIRLGAILSIKIVILAEFFSMSNGLGYVVVQAYDRFQFQRAWAWALVLVFTILAIEFLIFRQIESRLFDYREESELDKVGAGGRV